MAVVRSHHVDLKSPSMKVPPKRKGNQTAPAPLAEINECPQ